MTSPSRPPLQAHQRGDVDWIHRVGRGLLGSEPGTGKSRSAIEAFDGGRNLVIAPSLVIDGGTWADEIERWSDHPDRWQVAPYSMLNEREKLPSGGTRPLNLIKTGFRGRLREEFRGSYDAVIVDEAHYTKGRDTSWTWAVEEITKPKTAGAVLEMTGTPMPNWAHELYSILRVIFPEKAARGRELGSYWRWIDDWFETKASRFNAFTKDIGDLLQCRRECLERPAWDPCEHYHRFVQENLGEHFRRMLRDDCLDLPPLTEQQVHTPMDMLQKRMYRELKRDYATSMDGNEIVAWSQGAKNVLLDRITTSPWTISPDGPAKGGKFETLRFDLVSRSRPTLVLAHYRTSVEGCADIARQVGASAAYVHGGVSEKDAGKRVRDFQSGRLDVLVGSLETLAEGLTLTQADMAIFVETSYKPSRNIQAKYRIHRLGQTRPCTIRDYITPGTVDSNKRLLLATKTDRQMRVLTAAQFAALL